MKTEKIAAALRCSAQVPGPQSRLRCKKYVPRAEAEKEDEI